MSAKRNALCQAEMALAERLGDHWRPASTYFRAEAELEHNRLLLGLAAHLPALAPAILALGRHIERDDIERGCCGLPAADYFDLAAEHMSDATIAEVTGA